MCKGGKEINRKTALNHSSQAPGSTKAPVSSRPTTPALNHAARRADSTAGFVSKTTPRNTSLPSPAAIQIRALFEQVAELKVTVDNLERERDFYFAKLRDIDNLCQSSELTQIPAIKTIQRLLYADDMGGGPETNIADNDTSSFNVEVPEGQPSRPKDTDQDELSLYDSATEYKGERLEDSVSEFKGNGDEYGWVEDGALNACTYVDAYTLADPEHRILCNSASVEDFLPSVE